MAGQTHHRSSGKLSTDSNRAVFKKILFVYKHTITLVESTVITLRLAARGQSRVQSRDDAHDGPITHAGLANETFVRLRFVKR